MKTPLKAIFLSILFATSNVFAQGYIDEINAGNVKITGNTVSTTNTNGSLLLSPNGSGKVQFPGLTATTVPYLDSSKNFASSAVTPTELGRLSGVSSSLCGISDSCTLTNKSLSGTANTFTLIPYSALVLTGSVLNADLAGSIAYSKLSLTGSILNADLAGSIADSKLSTISTAGKVSNSATTATASSTGSTIVLRDSSGDTAVHNLTANQVTAALVGNADTVTTNHNMSGPITGTGNVTSVTAQTGTGTTFVMQASPTLTTPNLGTPSALVGTNISGTAASLTAGSVTTNANLTGDVTSSGNATTYSGTVPINKGGSGQTTANAAFNAFAPSQTSNSGKYLTTDGTNTSWGALVTTPTAVTTKSTTYTATTSDETIVADTSGAAWTLALPAAATNNGRHYRILMSNATTNALTIDPNLSETICGQTTINLLGQYDSIEITSNGTNWYAADDRGCDRTDYVLVNGTCTASPCTIASQSGGFTSVTRTGTGRYSMNFPSASRSAQPICVGSVSGQNAFMAINSGGSSTAETFETDNSFAGAGADSGFYIICRGPR